MEADETRDAIWWGVAAIAALILFVSNPNNAALRSRLAADGWVPVAVPGKRPPVQTRRRPFFLFLPDTGTCAFYHSLPGTTRH